jgi:GGDEF domain-containing protein
MAVDSTSPRVLLAAGPQERPALRQLFASGLLGAWEVAEADSLLRARFALQHTPGDVLLVDESLYLPEQGAGLPWLPPPSRVGVLLLGDLEPQALARAWQQGIHQWLPRRIALDHPAILAGALGQVARAGEWRRRQQRAEAALQECQEQRDRLLDLLWRAVPVDARTGWLTQRHLLERLQEEVVRSRRYGDPLTVALAELHPRGEGVPEGAPSALSDWVAERVGRDKRRCDVAGPYGPHGFLLLMVRTPAAGGIACCRRLQVLMERGGPRGLRGPVRAYFGLASVSDGAATGAGLLRVAEENLERAQGEGKGRVISPHEPPVAQGKEGQQP